MGNAPKAGLPLTQAFGLLVREYPPPIATEFGQVPNGPISHHRIEGGTGIAINCNDCHNSHLSQAAPNASVNPDNK